jgi:hypothetical protein
VDRIILKLESYCCFGHFEVGKLPFLCEGNSISDGFALGIPFFCVNLDLIYGIHHFHSCSNIMYLLIYLMLKRYLAQLRSV